jgi:hypothetical protein
MGITYKMGTWIAPVDLGLRRKMAAVQGAGPVVRMPAPTPKPQPAPSSGPGGTPAGGRGAGLLGAQPPAAAMAARQGGGAAGPGGTAPRPAPAPSGGGGPVTPAPAKFGSIRGAGGLPIENFTAWLSREDDNPTDAPRQWGKTAEVGGGTPSGRALLNEYGPKETPKAPPPAPAKDPHGGFINSIFNPRGPMGKKASYQEKAAAAVGYVLQKHGFYKQAITDMGGGMQELPPRRALGGPPKMNIGSASLSGMSSGMRGPDWAGAETPGWGGAQAPAAPAAQAAPAQRPAPVRRAAPASRQATAQRMSPAAQQAFNASIGPTAQLASTVGSSQRRNREGNALLAGGGGSMTARGGADRSASAPVSGLLSDQAVQKGFQNWKPKTAADIAVDHFLSKYAGPHGKNAVRVPLSKGTRFKKLKDKLSKKKGR